MVVSGVCGSRPPPRPLPCGQATTTMGDELAPSTWNRLYLRTGRNRGKVVLSIQRLHPRKRNDATWTVVDSARRVSTLNLNDRRRVSTRRGVPPACSGRSSRRCPATRRATQGRTRASWCSVPCDHRPRRGSANCRGWPLPPPWPGRSSHSAQLGSEPCCCGGLRGTCSSSHS